MIREFTKYIIKQKVNLADHTNEWIKLETFTEESKAWKHYDLLKGKDKLVLIRIQETLLAKTED